MSTATPQRRSPLEIKRDLEVAKLGVMCAKEPAERERWMARVDELRAELRALNNDGLDPSQ